MEIVYRDLSTIKPNPKNPRKPKPNAIVELAESIKNNPDYFEARPILLSDRTGELVIVGGERRSEAARYLEMEQVPTILIPNLTEERENELMILDNVHSGVWDTAKIDKFFKEHINKLDAKTKAEITNQRKGWTKGELEKCNLVKILQFHELKDFCFLSIFRKSNDGETFMEIKSNPQNVSIFAKEIYSVIEKTIGGEEMAIVTPPKRRNKEFNFSTEISKQIVIFAKGKIKFYEDALICESRQRINPDFHIVKVPKEKNIILLDDIFTTGSTIRATRELLIKERKNVFCIIGIYNGFSNR